MVFARNIRNYARQCVFHALLLGHISADDLRESTDIWSLVTAGGTPSAGASPARMFEFATRQAAVGTGAPPIAREIVTCQAGAGRLNALWNAEIARAGTVFGRRIFPGSRTEALARAELLAALPAAHDFLIGASRSAGEIMRQQMVLNAVHDAGEQWAAEAGNAAALQAYTEARAEAQTVSAYRAIGRQAETWVPLLKIVFECLYIGAFPMAVLLMLTPAGGAIFRSYVTGLIWLQSWGPLYAVLHRISMGEAAERMSAAASMPGGDIGISLVAQAGIRAVGSDVAVMSGYLSMSVPFLTDRRDPRLLEHTVETLVGQRVFALALGYEDLNDHDELRHDPLFHVLPGKLEAKRSDCAPVAGKSTLNRLEHRPRREAGKYHKIDYDAPSLEALFVDIFLDGHKRAPKEIVLDLDATEDTIHGEQEGRFFHGYYDSYCYLPLYIFCGRFLLGAKLRPANIDGAAGAVDEVARIVARIRARWPKVRIVLRGDSGFCREELMAWCEAEGVAYLFGLAPNARLKAVLAPEAWEAARLCRTTGKAARLFRDFAYQTETSWSRPRRVVGKAEHLPDGANPRFVVTSLGREKIDARGLYEDLYCARGEMENRIKECQLDLFADRTSSATMQANQLRLWFASMAYVLLSELRRIALRHTQFADATCGTIRLKLLKIGALVRRSVRRIKFAMASGFPWQTEFALAYLYLQRAFPR